MPISNLTPETAIPILLSTLPHVSTQNVFEGGVTKTVYYKIVNDLGVDTVFTCWFHGVIPNDPVVDYSAYCALFDDVGLNNYVIDPFPNCPVELPIKVDTTYWVEVRNERFSTPGMATPILNVNVTLKPVSTTYPAGQIIIFSASTNAYFEDYGGLNAGFIDPALGQIVNFLPFFPSTEGGDVLNNGTYLICDNWEITDPEASGPQDWYLLLLDPSFNIITRVLFPGPVTGGTFEPLIRTNNTTNKFWIGQVGYSGAPNRYASVSATGVLSTVSSFANLTPNTTIRAVAALNSESHLLVIPNSVAINNIHKWNLTTLAWDGTIGPVVANGYGNDLLVMVDDSIIIVYAFLSGDQNIRIKQYNLAGTELNSLIFNPGVDTTAGPRLGYSADPLYFWLWLPLEDGKSIIKKIKTTDFSLAVDTFVHNVYETTIKTSTPALIYTSDSCPIIETRVAGGVVIPPDPPELGGIYKFVKGKTNDSLYISHEPVETVDVKIPDPSVTHFLEGAE